MAEGPGLVLHLGAGDGAELEAYLAEGAGHVVLVEPNPTLAAALARRCAGDGRVRVLPVAVAERDGTAELQLFNLAALSSLRAPAQLSALFPGLRRVAGVEVETRSIASLLAELPPPGDRPELVVIDTPGEEGSVLEGLIAAGGLERFGRIRLSCGTGEHYAGSAPAAALQARLEAEGYRLEASDEGDPDRPVLDFRRDPLARELRSLRAELAGLRAAHAATEAELSAGREALQAGKARITLLETRLETTTAERRAQAETAAKRIAELETALAESRKAAEAAAAGRKAEAETAAKRIAELEAALAESRKAAETAAAGRKAEAETAAKRIAELEAALAQSRKAAEAAAAGRNAEAETAAKRIAELEAALAQSRKAAEAAAAGRNAEAETAARRLAELEAALTQSRKAAEAAEAATAGHKADTEATAARLAELEAALAESRKAAETLAAERRTEADAAARRLAEKDAALERLRTEQAEQIETLRGDMTLAVRMQAMRDADLKDLQQRHARLLAEKERQDDLLRRLTERLTLAAGYLQHLDGLLEDPRPEASRAVAAHVAPDAGAGRKPGKKAKAKDGKARA